MLMEVVDPFEGVGRGGEGKFDGCARILHVLSACVPKLDNKLVDHVTAVV